MMNDNYGIGEYHIRTLQLTSDSRISELIRIMMNFFFFFFFFFFNVWIVGVLIHETERALHLQILQYCRDSMKL